MARKPKNDDIGTIICPICGDSAPVRRDCNGKLYYVGKAGMIKPNMPAGQDWMLENADIWGKGIKPAEAANDAVEPVTGANSVAEVDKPVTAPLPNIILKRPQKAAAEPVNGYKTQKPVNDAQSQKTEKPSFAKWLIG
ncbi:hypothetical protein [Shewanella baltica]|uniref:hypothetical protein n=1 Tax=Shewanella baltica TaxID=62322 RepID=UPI003D79143B